jgi:hypothetical protein
MQCMSADASDGHAKGKDCGIHDKRWKKSKRRVRHMPMRNDGCASGVIYGKVGREAMHGLQSACTSIE